MRIAVLVGNGFDLSLGLDTSPRDFLSAFVERFSTRGQASAVADEAVSCPGQIMAEKIAGDGISEWSSYEEKLGEYSNCFSYDNADQYLEQVDALLRFLISWLANEDERVADDYLDRNAKPCIKSLAEPQASLPVLQRNQVNDLYSAHKDENRVVDILCFNYTSPLRRMYEKVGGESTVLLGLSNNRSVRLGKFIHVHDSLQDMPVTGVNDAGQISNQDIADDQQINALLIKGKMQKSIMHKNDDALGLNAIASAKLIIVFGMSFGSCDRRWWEQVLDRLRADKEALLLIFAYFPTL